MDERKKNSIRVIIGQKQTRHSCKIEINCKRYLAVLDVCGLNPVPTSGRFSTPPPLTAPTPTVAAPTAPAGGGGGPSRTKTRPEVNSSAASTAVSSTRKRPHSSSLPTAQVLCGGKRRVPMSLPSIDCEYE